jgi:nitroreductase
MPEPTFFEAARSQRGTRRYASDAVPDDLLQRILEAATWAPSGSNRQPWHFIVIRDPEVKRSLGDLYRSAMAASRGAEPPPPAPLPEDGGPPVFSDDLASVPVVIMVCLERWQMRGRDSLRGSHIFPAVQNLMLAAAALGLGTRLTTIWQHKDAEVNELLGIPSDVEAMAMIPLGYPGGDDHLGGSKRNPVSEATHFDRW